MITNTSLTKFFLFFRVTTMLSVLLVLVCCGIANAAGNEVDLTFNAVPSNNFTNDDDANLAIQPDGKIIVFGEFQVLNGSPTLKIARLNSNGTIDNSFNPNLVGFTFIGSVVVQPDGRILVGGSGGLALPSLIRLNSDGGPDGSFSSHGSPGGMSLRRRGIGIQADGKIFATSQYEHRYFGLTLTYCTD